MSNFINISLNSINYQINLQYQYEDSEINQLVDNIVATTNINGQNVYSLPATHINSLQTILSDKIKYSTNLFPGKILTI
ncbi:MAG: hypothetical protein AB8U25_04720 [Rickettsiales endosymbiont of Dermacentor nuttalli]